MSQGRSAFPSDPETLVTLVENQAALIAKLQRELEQLKFAYGKLLEDRFGPKSEKRPAGQLTLFDLPEEIAPPSAPIPEDEDLEHRPKRRRGGRRKLPQSLPQSLPREVIEHDLTDEESCCPDCGEMRERIGSEASEQRESVPAILKVLEHVRSKYACPQCQEHVALADKPGGLRQESSNANPGGRTAKRTAASPRASDLKFVSNLAGRDQALCAAEKPGGPSHPLRALALGGLRTLHQRWPTADRQQPLRTQPAPLRDRPQLC